MNFVPRSLSPNTSNERTRVKSIIDQLKKNSINPADFLAAAITSAVVALFAWMISMMLTQATEGDGVDPNAVLSFIGTVIIIVLTVIALVCLIAVPVCLVLAAIAWLLSDADDVKKHEHDTHGVR